MKVRKASAADISALSILFDEYRQFYGQESDREGAKAFIGRRIMNAESIAFLAFDEKDRPVGFAQLYPSFSSVSMGRIFILNDLFVRTEYRCQGCAKQLLDEAAKFAKAAGAIRLSLSTAKTNVTAQTLYEKNGWKKDEHFLSYDLAVPA